MTETTQEERDRLRCESPSSHWYSSLHGDKHFVKVDQNELVSLLNDADRLAAIERQVLWRTEDMPSDAKTWVKDRGEMPVYLCTEGLRLVEAPDHQPDMIEGELPILDPPEES